MTNKIKLVLAIRSLNIGGAERQFIQFIENIDKKRFDVFVVTMYGGIQEDYLKSIKEIKYQSLKKSGRYDMFSFYFNYKKLLKYTNPDVIYSFKPEMNIFSFFCKNKKSKIVWGFRASNNNLAKYGSLHHLLIWVQKILSPRVDFIVSNSNSALDYYKKIGYCTVKSLVIPNGIDVNKFSRSQKERIIFRDKFNLKDSDIAIIMVSRIVEIKGYHVYAEAAKKILDETSNIFFFSAGDGDRKIKTKCENILGKYNNERFFWLGNISLVENIYSGTDIYCSSSLSESFSNSIAEAMSCQLPCIATDVGDNSILLDGKGIIVEPNNVKELFEGLKTIIQSNIIELGETNRKRIENCFSTSNMVKATENLITKIA